VNLFPKNYRLRKRCEFEYLKHYGERIQNHLFLFNYAQNSSMQAPRLGITVTKKTGNAVVRNRIKRLVRETFRKNRHILTHNCDINVIAKRQVRDHSNQQCVDALMALFKRLSEGC
jgi:ribonuclease P protein component